VFIRALRVLRGLEEEDGFNPLVSIQPFLPGHKPGEIEGGLICGAGDLPHTWLSFHALQAQRPL
jgi:hypothetical protein